MAPTTSSWNGTASSTPVSKSAAGSTRSRSPATTGRGPTPSRTKLPGLASYSNIQLKRGISGNNELWKWREQIAKGNTERRNLSIVMLDDAGTEKIRWNLVNSWPTRWSAPDFDATVNDVAIESLELAHEGVSVDGWR